MVDPPSAAQLGDVDQAVHGRCQGDKGPELGEPRYCSDIGVSFPQALHRHVPRIIEGFFDGQGDTVIVPVQALDHRFDLLTDTIGVLEVFHPAPADFGDRHKAVDAADIDKQPEGANGRHRPLDALAFLKRFPQLLLFEPSLFFLQHSGREDDIPAAGLEL